MAEAAELRAGDLVLADPVWNEPDRNLNAWNGVLLHAHLVQPEAVDDVHAREVHEHGAIHGQIELVDRRDVVLRGRIGTIQSERIVGAHQFDIGAAELAVRAGILDVPGELRADHADHDGFVLGGERLHTYGPRGNRVADEQDDFDDGDGDFSGLGEFAFRARVAGAGVRAAPEAEEHEHEKRAPADEHDEHQPVDEDRHLVDFGSVRRRLYRHPVQH